MDERVLRLTLKRCSDCPFHHVMLAPHDWCQLARKDIKGLDLGDEEPFSLMCPLPVEGEGE